MHITVYLSNKKVNTTWLMLNIDTCFKWIVSQDVAIKSTNNTCKKKLRVIVVTSDKACYLWIAWV